MSQSTLLRAFRQDDAVATSERTRRDLGRRGLKASTAPHGSSSRSSGGGGFSLQSVVSPTASSSSMSVSMESLRSMTSTSFDVSHVNETARNFCAIAMGEAVEKLVIEYKMHGGAPPMESSSTIHSFFQQFSDPTLILSALSWLSIDGESSSFIFFLFPAIYFLLSSF